MQSAGKNKPLLHFTSFFKISEPRVYIFRKVKLLLNIATILNSVKEDCLALLTLVLVKTKNNEIQSCGSPLKKWSQFVLRRIKIKPTLHCLIIIHN